MATERPWRFDPPLRTRLADVIAVDAHSDRLGLIRYRYAGSRAVGAAEVTRDGWPDGCWPPAVGDVVRVREEPRIDLLSRPRVEGED